MEYNELEKMLNYLRTNGFVSWGELDLRYVTTKEDTINGKWEEYQIIRHIKQ